ncbi:hypothetical protein [Mucilaginibacter sp.]|uniref:hypothetical protein n=1 Tax=Mucilaginibacter sp. TaxID=1882438 RepID=UPI00374CB315
MARSKLLLEKHHLLSLRNLIEVNYGSFVSNSTDCLKISSLLAKGKFGSISSQTLRRFFGFVDTGFSPSINTLNVLCQYCGFEDWLHFHQKTVHTDILLQDVVSVCVAFFQIDIPPVKKGQLNEPYFYAVQNIAKLIYSDINLYNHVAPVLASNPTAHEYFFERFPFIDKLCCGLGKGYKFYMQNKKTAEASIFGNALLFLGAFLEEDLSLANKYLLAINKIKAWASLQIHPYVLARLIGSNIAYSHILNDGAGKEVWLAELDKVLNNNPNQWGHYSNSCEFEFIVCEYLLLSGNYDRVKNIMANVTKELKNQPLESRYNFYYIPCHIIYYKALIMTGNNKAARKVPFVDEPVNWQIKDYYTLHLLQCKLRTTSSKISKKALLNQYYHVLNLTGFRYFDKLM